MAVEQDDEALMLIKGFYFVTNTQNNILEIYRNFCLVFGWNSTKCFKKAKTCTSVREATRKTIINS